MCRMTAHLDFETRSACDITLGPTRYAVDTSTSVLCMAYQIEDDEPVLWTPEDGEVPRFLIDINKYNYVAWNIEFERAIIKHVLGLPVAPISQWIDPMARARALALPASLAACGDAIGLDQDKQKLDIGRKLILRFCKPYRGRWYEPKH